MNCIYSNRSIISPNSLHKMKLIHKKTKQSRSNFISRKKKNQQSHPISSHMGIA